MTASRLSAATAGAKQANIRATASVIADNIVQRALILFVLAVI
jgi:hypothetical protein